MDETEDFAAPDAGEPLADFPDPAFGETDAEDDETPDDDEPD